MTEPEDKVDLMAPLTPEDPRNSADLPACARDGDATGWEELFRRYNGLVRLTVASFRLQEAYADDAVQNTWLRVRERMDTIKDPECLGSWLATTASRECLALIQQFYKVDRATGMPLQDSIGPTRRALRDTLEQRGFVFQSGADVVEDVKWISREPTEGDRTGSHLLDDLLDQADQALRKKLEPKLTDIRTGSTQGTGDAQLDDLLHRADAALRAALHEQGTTVSSYLPTEENDHGDGRLALLPTDRSQEGTSSRAQLTEQEWADLFRQGRQHRLPAGTLLFLEGTRSDKVEVVISGQVKVFTTAEDGTEVVLAVRGPGALLGEFAAIDGQPHSASVRAVEPVEVLTIKLPDFTAFLQVHPRTMWLLLRILTSRLRDADRKRVEFGVYDVLTRVSCRLVELVERFGEPTESGNRITLPITRKELAGWVGASREAVTKALQTLRARGYIQTEHRRIIVIDIEGLRWLLNDTPCAHGSSLVVKTNCG